MQQGQGTTPSSRTARRDVLVLASGITSTTLAGCSGLIGENTGTVSVELTRLQIGDESRLDDFSTFEMQFDRVDLHPDGGETVTIDPSDTTLDLTTVERGSAVTVVDEHDIASGSYESADFYLPVVRAALSGESSVAIGGTNPLSMSTGALGTTLTVESGSETTVRLAVMPAESDDGTWELGASLQIPPS
jgi:hypothetical protein